MTYYEIINLIISFLAAAGTITATVVALYLANRQEPVHLKVSVYQAVVTGTEPLPNYLAISIVNRSRIPIQIDAIGWELPKMKRGLCMMLKPNELYENLNPGAKIPFYLAPGQKSSTFTIPWDKFKQMFECMMKRYSDGSLREEVSKRRIWFYVSTPLRDRNLLFDMEYRVIDAIVETSKIPYDKNIS